MPPDLLDASPAPSTPPAPASGHAAVPAGATTPDAREILAGVHHLQHEGHQVALFHIMDRAEVTLPFQGLAEVRDLETGQRMILDLDELRDAYLKQVEAHCDELRRGCAACQATYHRVETTLPVDHVLRMEAAHL